MSKNLILVDLSVENHETVDSWFTGQDLNPGHSKCEAGIYLFDCGD
jgi:hypothetical protein